MKAAPRRRRRLVVGLLGGIASGKSTAAEEFAACGAEVVDADAIAHGCLERPELVRELRERFGREVIRPDGTVDRGRLAAVAFASAPAREVLQKIVHPCVRQAVEERLAAEGPAVVVLDAPLLAEAGLLEACDATVFVDADRAARASRAAARGWPPGELERREAFQHPPEEKKGSAEFVIDNRGSRSRLREEVRRIHVELERRAAGLPFVTDPSRVANPERSP